MGIFRAANPEDMWKAIEGHRDVITPEVKKEESFFRNMPCPTCNQASNQAFVNPKVPFSSGSILPKKLLRCLVCSTEFDPETKIITKLPTDEQG